MLTAMHYPKLELTYFDMDGGRGEPARLALFIGGIPFTDDRISFAEFQQKRLSYPFARLPVLKIDDTPVTESTGILRYVGKLAGLYPSDPLEAARCDEVMGAVEDAAALVMQTFVIADAEEKRAAREGLAANQLPLILSRLQERLGDEHWFVEQRLTVADLRVFVWLRSFASGILDHIPTDLVAKHAPKLVDLGQRVADHDKVAAYYAKRQAATKA
jgi:glutathione S-transferase